MNTCSDDLRIKEEEFDVAHKILQNFENIEESSLYQKSLQRLEELKELDISGVFICVGCGPLPSTLIFAKKNFFLKELFGIDNDPKALSCAHKVYSHVFGESIEFQNDLKKVRAQNSMETLHFFVANMVKPKMEILKSIWSLASHESIVIVREPGLDGSGKWDHISNSINPHEWDIKKCFPPCPYFGSRSIVLSKATNKKTV